MYRILKISYFKSLQDDTWGVNFTAVPGVLVTGIADAKRRFGGAPVLEWAGGVR
jgi:hypothetical protein